jgi:Flp pilus assembly pilin Flp
VTQLRRRLWSEERGASLTEYALLLLLICLVVVAGMRDMASDVVQTYVQASNQVISGAGIEFLNTKSNCKGDPNQPTHVTSANGTEFGPCGEKVYGQSSSLDVAKSRH